MNEHQKSTDRHSWRPAHRHNQPTRLAVRRRTLDGVRGEPFLVHPIPLHKKLELQPSALRDTTRLKTTLGTTARRLSLLEEATKQAQPAQKKSFIHMLRPTKLRVIAIVAMLVVSATSYVTFDTWATNRTVLAQAEQQQAQSSISGTAEDSHDQAQSAQTTATDTRRYSLDDYKVAPSMPRAMFIKKINMSGRILPMGVKDGAVDAPKNAYDAGWYTGSAKPGTAGAAFFDGHASGRGNFGLFGNLHKLTDGDIISVEMGDGTRYDYKVVAKEQVGKDSVDMTKALKVQGGTEQGATFIACAGTWIESEKTLSERLLVYTERI